MEEYMINVYPLLLLALLVSCSTSPTSPTMKKNQLDAAPRIVKVQEAQQVKIRPGEAQFLKFKVTNSDDLGVLTCKKQTIPLYRHGDARVGYVAETYFSSKKPFTCTYNNKDLAQRTKVAKFSVIKKKFPFEKLNVAKKRVSLNKKDLARVRKEQAMLNKIYKKTAGLPWFDSKFQLPIDSFVTSIYGTRRIYNNHKKGQHLGTDFRAKVGEVILSANKGKVVFSGDLFYTGYTVIIDHGLGIFTNYGHLSKLLVNLNEIIPKGTALGLAGKSGRVTGPHLHWGVKVNSHYIDGRSFAKLKVP